MVALVVVGIAFCVVLVIRYFDPIRVKTRDDDISAPDDPKP